MKGVLCALITDAEIAGKLGPDDARTLRNQVSHDRKEGKKLRSAFEFAVGNGIFTQDESDELQELLDYRNDIAHRIHEIMADITRYQWNAEMFEVVPPAYKSNALDRLCQFRSSLSERVWQAGYTLVIGDLEMVNGPFFEHAENVFKHELLRLEKVISRQIARENQLMREIRVECDLTGTEMQDELHPRHYLNFYQNGHDGGPKTGRLTKRGAEICYRLFDLGKSPIAVAYLMGISLRAAKLRQKLWKNAGGVIRRRMEL